MMKLATALPVVVTVLFFSPSARAQDDSTLQVVKKMLAEIEQQSSQRNAPVDNKVVQSSAGPNDNRSVMLGRSAVREAPPPPVKETRVYDLADLFAVAPAFQAQGWVGWDNQPLLSQSSDIAPFSAVSGGGMGGSGMGGMGGGMGGMMRVPPHPTKTTSSDASWKPTPKDLIEAIENTVDAEWASEGGKETMFWLGSSLLVTAYPETHSMVKRMLDLLQPRWNARVTLETRVHWLWLSFAEEEKLGKLMVDSDQSPVRSIEMEALSNFISTLPADEARPAPIHARLQSHNGQLVSWVSGSQERSVVGWGRGEKGKLIPEPAVVQHGVACEVMSMLAHASEHATIVFNSRYNAEDNTKPNRGMDDSIPIPDRDRSIGQSIAGTVRVPIGRGTIVGGGTSVEPSSQQWQLAVVVTVDLVSPRERVER